MKKCKVMIFLMVVLVGMTFASAALAEYPDKPVTYVICFNPGGESDITARIQQQPLEKILGVPVVMVYKKGGGGAVGWSELMRTKPDGYTIYGTNLPHTIVQPMTRGNAGYETEKINNVYMFEFTPDILAVKADSEIKTLDDFVKYAKENPGISVGGSGQPSANSLGCEAFGKVAGLKLTYISFTGSGAAVPALLGGHVKALMTYTSMAAQYPDKIRALAVAADKRAKALPDVPTFKELGYEFVEGAYRGVAVPPGTPKEIKQKLEQAFEKVNYDPVVVKKMEDLGFIMEYYGEGASKELVAKLSVYYRQLLKDLGLLK
ncbi:MAG: tripartite tricarboxylate transporter substrate binding protein [Deltaproteobacteria bacterium]|nr:tripartite tricarboxylate transporter substrate binding protein [Deltaproteobacteria bacterium]